MAKKPFNTPKYRRQKRSTGADRAFIELAGQRHYLGRYDSPQSKQHYHRLLAEWTAQGCRPRVEPNEITVTELAAAFWTHAQAYYRRPDGSATSEADNFRQALRPLKELYGDTLAVDFGPKALGAVRQKMIKAGWCRTNINKQVNRLRHVFKWATAQELIPPTIYQGLCCLAPLKPGRSNATESTPKRPVPEAHIAAVRPWVSQQVWALIRLQLLTGARAGELVKLRPIDLDTGGRVWTATLADHKTAHHGYERVIYFGPQAQAVIQEFLVDRPIDAFLFSAIEAQRQRHDKAQTHRRLNQKSNPRKTGRVVRNHYDVASFRRAIRRACDKANVLAWHPHQLRHNAATNLRKEFGLEAAQLMLGHAKADVTQLYAEVNRDKAIRVTAKIG